MTTTLMTLRLLQPLPQFCRLSRLAREAGGMTETTSPELQRTGAKSSSAGRRCQRRRRRRRSAAALQWAVAVAVVAGQLLLLLLLPLLLLLLLPLLTLGDERSSSTARPARRAFEVQKALALSLSSAKKTPSEF